MIRDWKNLFDYVKAQDYSKTLHAFLDEEYSKGICYPSRDLVYNAFALTKPEDLKVVIIGQDPYHNPGQAMGLSFSVPNGMELPPSLVNIYKEIQNDIGIKMNFENGDLTPWAKQGVLLLNAYLSVRAGQPLSHKRDEYEHFIADVMRYLDNLDQPIVFMLWGSFAKRYSAMVHNKKHFIVACSHPSPLSANRGGWFGQKPFSRCNSFLEENGSSPIDWGNR
ncbi:MAG: uracil-DNA glycosylase [Bacilli bacterium]|nr:uracil-DNA glycosylase [Bacilli bacterium]